MWNFLLFQKNQSNLKLLKFVFLLYSDNPPDLHSLFPKIHQIWRHATASSIFCVFGKSLFLQKFQNFNSSVISNFCSKNKLLKVCAVTDSSVCIFLFDIRRYYFLQFWLPGALYFCNWNEFVGFPRRQRQLFRYSKCSKVEKAFTSCSKVILKNNHSELIL